MHVAHTFEVVQQAEVAAVVCLGYVYPFFCRCFDGRPNPKPRPYLHLWVGVWIFLLRLVTPSGPAPGAWMCSLPPVLLLSGGMLRKVGVKGVLEVPAPLGG